MVLLEAAINKYRFPYKGECDIEDLCDMSVEQLDEVYIELKSKQKNTSEESLLKKVTEEDRHLENKIKIVKTIVEYKLNEKKSAAESAARKAQAMRIKEIIATKKDESLMSMSIDELQDTLKDIENE